MTLSEKAYSALRHDIIRGELGPGKPLRMADLSARYDMGFSPLREALNRLQSERFVVAEALRGFKVAPLSVGEMQDAIDTRILIESDCLAASIRNGKDEWAAAIVSALYALKLQVGRTGAEADIWQLEARHYVFHRALLAACGSAWKLEFFDRLYAATERYRIPILLDTGVNSGRDVQAEHTALADATLGRETDRALGLLQEHYLRSAAFIKDSMMSERAVTSSARRSATAS